MKEIVKIKPKMLRSDDGLYTIFSENLKGGAIISNYDPFVAMEKFKEGTHLCMAVKTLMEFSKGNKVSYIAEFI